MKKLLLITILRAEQHHVHTIVTDFRNSAFPSVVDLVKLQVFFKNFCKLSGFLFPWLVSGKFDKEEDSNRALSIKSNTKSSTK